MTRQAALLAAAVLITSTLLAQKEGDVIINEIGNNGTKKAMYTGGDYVELLVLNPEGARLAGWYLTDLSGQGSEGKENEGSVKFSDTTGSIFTRVLTQGTYILVCLGTRSDNYGDASVREDVSMDDGNNRIVVFAYDSPGHVQRVKGTISFTGRDNVAFLSDWKKNRAIDIVTWEGSSSWSGAAATTLVADAIGNGVIAWFVPLGPKVTDLVDNFPAESWKSSPDVKNSSPGSANPGVNDSEVDGWKR